MINKFILASFLIISMLSISSNAGTLILPTIDNLETNSAVKFSAGLLVGTLAHHSGHIAGIKYAGGSFDGITRSKGDFVVNVTGSRSQIGLSSLMGNNASIVTSDLLIKKDSLTAYESGVLAYSIIKPIVTILSTSGGDISSAEFGLTTNTKILAATSVIPSVLRLVSVLSSNPIHDASSSISAGLTGKYLNFSTTGLISTRQKIWAFREYKKENADVSIGIQNNNFGLFYGQHLISDENYAADIFDYIAIEKNTIIDGFNATIILKVGKQYFRSTPIEQEVFSHKKSSFNLSLSKNNVFFEYDSLADTTIAGLTIEF